jgi:transketolase
VHASTPAIEIGKAIALKEGREVALLSTGAMLPEVLALADLLRAQGIDAGVYSVHTVKPLDVALLGRVFAEARVVVTIEEHSILGGLGGSVAEWKSDHSSLPAKLLRLGSADEFLHLTCEQEEAREHFGLVPSLMLKRILSALD